MYRAFRLARAQRRVLLLLLHRGVEEKGTQYSSFPPFFYCDCVAWGAWDCRSGFERHERMKLKKNLIGKKRLFVKNDLLIKRGRNRQGILTSSTGQC